MMMMMIMIMINDEAEREQPHQKKTAVGIVLDPTKEALFQKLARTLILYFSLPLLLYFILMNLLYS